MTPEEFRQNEGAEEEQYYVQTGGPNWPVIMLWAFIFGTWGASIALWIWWE